MTTTTIGVVTVDEDKDLAHCTQHGRLAEGNILTGPEWYADRHVNESPNCWADHCGGKGCTNPTCVCNNQAATRGAADFVPDGGDHA